MQGTDACKCGIRDHGAIILYLFINESPINKIIFEHDLVHERKIMLLSFFKRSMQELNRSLEVTGERISNQYRKYSMIKILKAFQLQNNYIPYKLPEADG